MISKTKSTILIVDDHKLVRQGLHTMLESCEGFEVIGEASDGAEALSMAEELQPDIVILDVMMPNMNGIEAAKVFQDRKIKSKIVFLSMHANASYAVRAMHNGAMGYVLKDADFSEVLQALKNVMDGKRYISSAIEQEVFEMLLSANSEKVDSLEILSTREREVMQLIAEGNTNNVIAQKLSLSTRTVETHRAHIMSKLRLSSHADLIKVAIQYGLISP
jgi:DNA-binding NarL/FixJ family response regulator